MSNLSYAEVGENSPYAGAIGWVDFNGITIRPGNNISGMEVIAKDGTVITFDLACTFVSGNQIPFTGVRPPSFTGAVFGRNGYKSKNSIVLYNSTNSLSGVCQFTFSNIQVKSRMGSIISDFGVVVADGERTNQTESLQFTTSGTAWSMLVNIPSGRAPAVSPIITGMGTTTVLIAGAGNAEENAPVFVTSNPSSIIVNIGTNAGKQGFAIGFVVTSITLYKDIVKRVDPADQFVMTISGAKTSQVTTTGTTEGIQAEIAQVHVLDGSGFIIDEALANNRTNGLADYKQVITAVNLAEGGSSPAVGALPINNTAIWGDMIEYTIQNRPDMSDVWIEKSTPYESRNAGESIIFVIVVGNDGPDDAVDVELTDTMNADVTECMYLQTGDTVWRNWDGTLAIGTLPVGEKEVFYIRGRIQSGSRLTQLSNTASISTANYDPNLVNNEATSVLAITYSADITITKTADHIEATRGSGLTYTLRIENLGPSDMDNIIVTDTIPVELQEVKFSLDGGTTWAIWNGVHVIAQLRKGETTTILIKGIIKF